MRLHRGGKLRHPLLKRRELLRLHKTEMPGGKLQRGLLRKIPQHRDTAVLLHQRLQPRIKHRRNPVQDNTGNLAAALVSIILHTLNFGAKRNTDAPGIGDQEHRCIGELRNLVGTRRAADAAQTVVVAHDPLQHRELCRVLTENAPQPRRVRKIAVQVAAWDPQYFPVEHRVNVVGAALKGSELKAPLSERCQQAAGDSGFPRTAVHRCQHDSR